MPTTELPKEHGNLNPGRFCFCAVSLHPQALITDTGCSGCRQVRTVHGRVRPHRAKEKKCVGLACRLAIASFACGRPPPLEASHSLSSKANLRRQWQFLDGRKAHFHVCADTMRWNSSRKAVWIVSQPLFKHSADCL